MKFGPVPPTRIPKQDPGKVLLLAERWQRAGFALSKWAERARQAVDFFEGRQWTAAQIAEFAAQKRPNLKFNVIAPLVRLILGYQAGHKTDITFEAGQDAMASDSVAEILTNVEKVIATGCQLQYIDTEVFLDGMLTGRGFYDSRLDWEHNDLGQIKSSASDPFATYIDPDCTTYDLNESAAFVQKTKMVSIDEMEGAFGKNIASLVKPFTMGQTPLAPLSSIILNDEITPVRTFGERSDSTEWWDSFYSLVGDFVDTHRKTIRIIESQYKVSEQRNVIIDLETGDKKALPEHWGRERLEKLLLYAQSINNPCVIQRRAVTRVQWTTMVGDLLIHDAPSLYDRYTITGFFPYFRRGMTKGMVEDLIDPQIEKNKRRIAEIETVSKTANGGWIYHQDSLDPVQEARLKKFGAVPGVNIKWKGEADKKPTIIESTSAPMKHERLERQADDDMRTISGVNESALGELDRVQSGRAIEARQRQTVAGAQPYFDAFKRTKMLLGDMHLGIIQNHYTEPRLYRIRGEDKNVLKFGINQTEIDADGIQRILNDVTVGKYTAVIDDAPLSATFLNAQYEEMLTLLEKMGPALGNSLPMFADLIIEMSSMPRKKDWIDRFKMLMGAGGGAQGAGGAEPPPGGAPAPDPTQGGNVVPFNAATAGA